ncbi:hypothetical protein PCOAH_00053220 [Plasmodium coatneyi]|uniref:Uncharacterized protein n=1 Tax=Plasmodium coatneyi TaxID=208452 RepID=A0A1B1E826_9APIC|nr:hypothetical protein PCOAH_00053220 [Plasmodium coatneyi]ANQ11117.1 hypothetical protein PCOAH_00053220 [Plasmodium coatneyi]
MSFTYYKPWTSWFGIHSNGKRKKRSAGRDIDDLTETSTMDFTGSSEGSSILDSPTVSSSAYTTQPGGKTNNSTRDRGMVGYQNMRCNTYLECNPFNIHCSSFPLLEDINDYVVHTMCNE